MFIFLLFLGGGNDLQRRPWEDDVDPFQDFPDPAAMERLYSDNEIYILAPHQLSDPNVLVFNFPVAGSVAHGIFHHQGDE